jgi:putative molybdopterin biosynthesis protein
MSLVGRQQGLMVHKGNPKGIHDLTDLTRQEITFINRQRGAGTRVLLDFHLGLMGLDKDSIRGYEQEEYTHLGVAAAIASGRADCGLGIAAAAIALDLDYLPLFNERYDLVIPKSFYTSEILAPLFSVINSPDFHRLVSTMPGYDVSVMGQIIAELP